MSITPLNRRGRMPGWLESVATLMLVAVLLLLAALMVSGSAQALGGKGKMVEARLSFDHQGLPGKMELYAAGQGPEMRVWNMGIVDDIDELPLGKKVEGAFQMRQRGYKKLVLVFRNPGREAVYFFAPPHQVIPAEQGIGFAFKCVCVHTVFKVPPGQVWYRVIALKLFPAFRGGPIELRHSLVGISEAEALRIMK